MKPFLAGFQKGTDTCLCFLAVLTTNCWPEGKKMSIIVEWYNWKYKVLYPILQEALIPWGNRTYLFVKSRNTFFLPKMVWMLCSLAVLYNVCMSQEGKILRQKEEAEFTLDLWMVWIENDNAKLNCSLNTALRSMQGQRVSAHEMQRAVWKLNYFPCLEKKDLNDSILSTFTRQGKLDLSSEWKLWHQSLNSAVKILDRHKRDKGVTRYIFTKLRSSIT